MSDTENSSPLWATTTPTQVVLEYIRTLGKHEPESETANSMLHHLCSKFLFELLPSVPSVMDHDLEVSAK